MRAIQMLFTALAMLVLQPACAPTQTGYTAVWQPGSGVQFWHAGMTFDAFKTQNDTYLNQGLRIKSLAIRDDRFAAVWRPGSGVQFWHAGLTADQLAAWDNVYRGQGLRIAALEIDNRRFAAVWQPGSGAQVLQPAMTYDAFKTQDQIHYNRGLRIAALVIEEDLFTAVWRPGSGDQFWHAGMTEAQLETQDRTYAIGGLRLSALAIDSERYTAVWRPGSGAQLWSLHRCLVDVKTEDTAYLGQGLRLGIIKLQKRATSAYRYPWKSGESHIVTQGNDNPAAGGHNGGQKYAFDFRMGGGTQIRAARDGTVEWLQDNLTVTQDPKTNTPPLAGREIWGNAVRILHPGGFTSWYFHIQHKGVLVNVGDAVQSGQPIATSGNTGRSDEPHLHFQVQADATDWGQSVPISFGNCQVPTTKTKVTSDNANSNFP